MLEVLCRLNMNLNYLFLTLQYSRCANNASFYCFDQFKNAKNNFSFIERLGEMLSLVQRMKKGNFP